MPRVARALERPSLDALGIYASHEDASFPHDCVFGYVVVALDLEGNRETISML